MERALTTSATQKATIQVDVCWYKKFLLVLVVAFDFRPMPKSETNGDFSFGLLLHNCGNPAALVRRGERYNTTGLDGLLHQAIASSGRCLGGYAH